MQNQDGVIVRRAELGEIFQVRWEVLRPGAPREAAVFPGDESPETIHAGGFDAGGANVACATLTRSVWEDEPAYQLRGMGVVKAYQGTGVGKRLIAELEGLGVAASGLKLFWCNAREEALGFYERLGWRVASERFMVEDVGPHFRMYRRV